MNKLSLICVALLTCGSLAAYGNRTSPPVAALLPRQLSITTRSIAKGLRARLRPHQVLLARPINKPRASRRTSNPLNLARTHNRPHGVASSRLVIRRLKAATPLPRIRPVQCWAVPMVTCRQRGHRTAGPSPEMATRPLSGMTGVWNITNSVVVSLIHASV